MRVSTSLSVGGRSFRIDMSVAVHRLPVKTTFRGTTDMHHFTDGIRQPEAPAGPLKARLRGRRLVGRPVTVPPSTLGAILVTSLDAARSSQEAAPPASQIPSSTPNKRERDGDELITPPSRRNTTELSRAEFGPAASAPHARVLGRFSKWTTWEHDREPNFQSTDGIAAWVQLARIVMPCPAVIDA
jgi:hypothetical protein